MIKLKPTKKFDAVSEMFCIIFWIIVLLFVLYPLWLIVIASVSDPDAVVRGRVLFLPVDFSLLGYQALLKYPEIWTGYLNAIFYTLGGTALSVLVTLACAYALTRKFPGKKIISFLIIFTMFFSGGLIPIYLNIRNLHLYNTRTVMILMNLVSVWNLMVARRLIEQVTPDELIDAAMIDGADHFTIFFRFVLPLSGSGIAVLSMYYGSMRWNDYFTGLIMLRDRNLFPLQLVLKDILASYNAIGSSASFFETYSDSFGGVETALRLAEAAKYCGIVISVIPPVLIFFVLQRHFRKGVLLGSFKS